MADLYTKKPITVCASQWFKNGDHPLDVCYMVKPDSDSATQFEPFLSEGKLVRRYNHPDVSGDKMCEHCKTEMENHGWIDTLGGGHTVCPGDWIITGIKGEHYPCKPDIFAASYDKTT
jgi:hypothetical protein